MNTGLIRQTLKINALFSGISGLVMLVFSESITRFMGRFPALITELLGVGLIVFAADVLWLATRKTLPLVLVKLAFYADVAWVAATPVVMFVFRDYLSFWGQLLLADVAVAVLVFAYFEGKGLRGPVMAVKA